MMIFRLIISAFRFLPLVYGNRRSRPAPQRASHPRVDDYPHKHLQGATLADSFTSRKAPIPISGRDPEWTEHEVRVARVRAACPRAGIAGDEFTEISAGAGGSVQIFFADGPITLKRTWLPLTPGFYSTGDSSELGVKMQYNVSMDGTVDVKLGCACGGDTGFKKYELVGTGIDNPYEVKPIEDGDTLEDLVGSLKMACPGFSEDSFLTDNYQRVGFATEDVIYVTGDFITDSLHRQLS